MTITLSGTVSFESRSSTWALELGGKSGTPTVEISVTNRNIIKVTAQFNGSNGSAPGFYFDIVSLNPDVKALTPTTGIAQGNTGWTSCVQIDFFLAELPQNQTHDTVDFEDHFLQNDLGGDGQRLNNFVLIAEIVGSNW